MIGSSLYAPNLIGGAERVAQALAANFIRLGHKVSVITTQPTGAAHAEVLDGVSVHYIPVRNLYRPFTSNDPGAVSKTIWRLIDSFNPFMLKSLSKVIAQEKPDVLNTHNISGLSVAVWAAARQLGVPIVHTLHDQYLLCHRSTMHKHGKNCRHQCFDCGILGFPRKLQSQHVVGVIGVSKFILERHERFGYFKSAAPKVIYNNTQSGVATRDAAHRRNRKTMRFGFLGQIIPTKGLHDLIDAFSKARLPGVELWIAGRADSAYASALMNRTQLNSGIRWLGFVDADTFLRDIDILVVPSAWHDTAPLVIREAYARGVPVLGAERGGIPELVDTRTGWLFDPETTDSLRKALRACIESSDQIHEKAEAALIHAREFESAPWTHQYLDAFNSAITQYKARDSRKHLSDAG